MSRTEPAEAIHNEFVKSPSRADQTQTVIGPLAVAISIVLGIMAGLLCNEFVVGLAWVVVVSFVVVFGAGLYWKTISEKLSRKEAQVRREIPKQQSNLRGDAAKPTEPQTAPEGVAVRKGPRKPDDALAECESNTILCRTKSMLTTGGCILFCARCGQALRYGVKFCEKCGAKVREYAPESPASPEKERLCGNCGCAVTGDSKTCKWCGTDVK